MTRKRWATKLNICLATLHRRLTKVVAGEITLEQALSPSDLPKRTERFITFRGKTQNIISWAKDLGFKPITLYKRLDKMPLEKAMTSPLRIWSKFDRIPCYLPLPPDPERELIRQHPSEYKAYWDAKRRCTDKKWEHYKYYGGRGIRFLFLNFKEFYEELGDKPIGLTLDRIKTEGHYEPGNVRWADWDTQAKNRRCCHVGITP